MTAATPGERFRYVVVNTSDLPINLGEAYVLDRLTGDEWEEVPVRLMFRLWGRRLGSEQRSELSARIPEFIPPGRYRLRKRLDVDRDPVPGYEWIAHQQIDAIEVVAELEVAICCGRRLDVT